MTEREKIIKILNKSFMQKEVVAVFVADDGQETELPQEICKMFNDIVSQAVIPYFADALIENGIGDIAEWKARAERAECILSEYNRYSEVINNKLDKAIELVNGMLKQVKSEEERK